MSETGPAKPQQIGSSGRRYSVEAPKRYGVLDPFAAPSEEIPTLGVQLLVKPKPSFERKFREKPEGPEKRAIWIVHGMGQQVPFETLDGLAEGVMRVGHQAGGGEWAPKFRAVKVGDQTLQRVELTVEGHSGKEYELHLYEAYWAPKTEGVAKIADVVSFLWDGGTRGLLNCVKKFKRVLFGEICEFRVRFLTPFYIGAVMSVLAGLTLLNAVIVAASAAKVAKLGGAAVNLPSLTDYFAQISAVASTVSAVAITFGCVLFLAQASKPSELQRWYRMVLQWLSWTGTVFTSVAIFAGGVLLGGVVLTGNTTVPGASAWKLWVVRILYRMGDSSHLQEMATLLIVIAVGLAVGALLLRGVMRSDRMLRTDKSFLWGILFIILGLVFVCHISAILYPILLAFRADFAWLKLSWIPLWIAPWIVNPIWVWPFLIFMSTQIKTLLVEYVGDVAIYVTPNKMDRFDDVRAKIKDIALKSASAVYLAQHEGSNEFEYKHIAVVGHSLGSVIAYDALNHLMNDDVLSGNKINVVKRTKLFESFGSPLDKTTFFFTIQGKDSFQIREQLAAVVQPLIQNEYEFRKFPWINVYSRNDIISGHLDYFDYPRDAILTPDQRLFRAQWQVWNYQDEDAAIALVAHVDYWKNTTASRLLYDHIAP